MPQSRRAEYKNHIKDSEIMKMKKADPGIGKVRQRVCQQASNHIRYTGQRVAGALHRPEED
jgi:hypothetical protein